MTREEALKQLSWNAMSAIQHELDKEVVHLIFDDLGSCAKCEHFDTTLGSTPNDGHCKILRDTEQALWVNIETESDWYCKDFKRKKND